MRRQKTTLCKPCRNPEDEKEHGLIRVGILSLPHAFGLHDEGAKVLAEEQLGETCLPHRLLWQGCQG